MESFEFRFEDELFSRDGFFGEKMWEYRKGVVEYIARGRSVWTRKELEMDCLS